MPPYPSPALREETNKDTYMLFTHLSKCPVQALLQNYRMPEEVEKGMVFKLVSHRGETKVINPPLK
jgi:hypothetical protein